MKYLFLLCVLGVFVVNPLFSHADLPAGQVGETQSAIDFAVRGEYQKAVNLVDYALSKSPDNLQARLVMSHLYLETGEYQKAEALLEYFPALSQSAIAALKSQDLLYLAQGIWLYATRKGDKDIFQKVARDYLPMIEKSSDDPALRQALYLFWGNCYLEKGDLPAAAGCFSDTLKANSSAIEAHLGLARSYYAVSNREKAVYQLNTLVGLLSESDDTKPAGQTIRKTPSTVLPIASIQAEAYNLLAVAQLMNEQFPNALDSVNKSLSINPNSVSCRATKASIYYLSNKMPEFEKECKAVLEVNKNPALFYLIIGNNLDQRLFYTEATGFYEKALAMDEHLWDARIAAGFNYMHLGPDYEERGRKLLDEAFARDPFNVKVHNMLKVLDALKDEFEIVKTRNFEIKMHKNERFLLEPYMTDLLEDAYEKFTTLYQHKPITPLLVEAFPNHNDFSVRLMGFPGFIAARGVCFARTFLVLSPKAQEQMADRFHWGSITVHEFMHIITLQMSRFRVPRWFTEGCSVYAEKLYNPAWGEEVEDDMVKALSENKLKHLSDFVDRRDADVTHSYYLGSVIIEYIHHKYGMETIIKMLKSWGAGKDTETVFKECLDKTVEEFDKEFFGYFNSEFLKGVNLKEFQKAFNSGRELFRRNKASEAIAEFIRAKQFFPRYTKSGFSPYHYLISIYEETNQPEKMYAEIEELIKINHTDFPNRMKLAKRYVLLKQYDKLVTLLKDAAYLEPESIQLHNYLARGLRAQKEYDAALREYDIALRLAMRTASSERNKVLADFYCSQAEIYLELDNKPRAKELLIKAEELYPDHKKIGELMRKCD
ncbi:MAG: tetratricopeptide repeat protein [Planctomycetota bacterium]